MPMWVWIAAGLGAWVALSLVLGLLLGRFLAGITPPASLDDERFWLDWEQPHPADTVARERDVPEGPTARHARRRAAAASFE
jgi:hypothetical protein